MDCNNSIISLLKLSYLQVMEDLAIPFNNPTAYAKEYKQPARGAPNPYNAF